MTANTLLSTSDQEEAMSWAYIRAVAGFAGYTISVEDFDRSGIDLRIHAGGVLSPSIGLQLKATINLGPPQSDSCFHYPLKVENYNRLVRPSQVPRYLVVLDLPTDKADWLEISDRELVLRHCAYWVSLADETESSNSTSVTVKIPAENRFAPEGLRGLLERSRALARGLEGNR